jgi:hypothetical protein
MPVFQLADIQSHPAATLLQQQGSTYANIPDEVVDRLLERLTARIGGGGKSERGTPDISQVMIVLTVFLFSVF